MSYLNLYPKVDAKLETQAKTFLKMRDSASYSSIEIRKYYTLMNMLNSLIYNNLKLQQELFIAILCFGLRFIGDAASRRILFLYSFYTPDLEKIVFSMLVGSPTGSPTEPEIQTQTQMKETLTTLITVTNSITTRKLNIQWYTTFFDRCCDVERLGLTEKGTSVVSREEAWMDCHQLALILYFYQNIGNYSYPYQETIYDVDPMYEYLDFYVSL